MRRSLAAVTLAACLAVCAAACQPGLNGRNDWYLCEGLTDLNLQIPANAAGISIVNSAIKRINTDAFAKFGNSLTQLNITGSGVEEIEPDAFRGLNKLQLLGLHDNKLQKIDSSWIRGLPNLRSLLLYRNRISEIDPQIYDILPELALWDLAYNNLNECLTAENLRKLKKLKLILITGNPWKYRCRSSMTWYLGSNHIRFVRDWSIMDLLIEDCLFHEPGAQADDAILNKCVDRKITTADSLPVNVGALNEQVRELTQRLIGLEAEVNALKKS